MPRQVEWQPNTKCQKEYTIIYPAKNLQDPEVPIQLLNALLDVRNLLNPLLLFLELVHFGNLSV